MLQNVHGQVAGAYPVQREAIFDHWVHAGAIIHSHSPLSQTLLLGPIRKLSQQGIYGKLLMTGGNRSVYARIIYIMHNSLYFICILTGFCQRIFEKAVMILTCHNFAVSP